MSTSISATEIGLPDNAKLKLGTGEDLQIYHDGTDSIIDSGTGNLKIIAPNDVTAIQVFNDGTVNIGSDTDNVKLRFGIGSDLQIYHDGSHSYIADTGTGNLNITASTVNINNAANSENIARFIENGAVELYHNNSKRLETTSTGVNFGGNLSSDSGANFTINGGGASGSAGSVLLRCASENAVVCNANGSVDLYHNNSKRFETISDGTKIKGNHQLVSEDGNANIYKSAKYYNIGTNTSVTITLASLATGYGVFRMGGYGNAGQAALGLHLILGGFMTGTAYYQVDVLQNFTHANCSISLAKNAGNYVITVNNTSSSSALILSMSLESSGGKMTMTIA